MKALQITDYRGPETMLYQETERPTVQETEVLIKVDYSGVGLIDIIFSRGFGALPLPATPGLEVAGTVVDIGKEVRNFQLGDRVAGLTINTLKGFSELVSLPEDYVVKIPENLGIDKATAALTNTATALVLLKEIVRLPIGANVLVYGATGGLGAQVGQAAKLLGAKKVVAAVSNETKCQNALELGYDAAYLREECFISSEEKFDLIVDPVGGVQRKDNLGKLNPYGTLAIVGNASQEERADINPDICWLNNLNLTGFNFGGYCSHHIQKVNGYLIWALELVANNQIKLPKLYKAPIDNAVQSLLDLEEGKINGKLLLKHP
ncbi:quinone oxidoreductase family protein [Streptococcus panodentis]|uniref:Oxidoreductase n=1 Tax=Streptococcus panodentis TaxID=1581472 RepID=A0ABS5AXZ9_9STRE|nr:zinc-binding alcohol dehydrogenase family protein [Streptococcus panodentis]MBP2621457.1 oxidoreductase [Streptococcus panodentis]